MLEKEIIINCADSIFEQFKSGQYISKIDYEIGFDFGIADIMIFWISKKLLEKRAKSKIYNPITNRLSYYIFFNAPEDREFNFNELLKLLNITNNTTAKAIKYNNIRFLVKNNYFLQINNNIYKKNNKYFNPVKKIIAIEIKISDWKSGLLQAQRYTSFSDESYLGLWDRFIEQALKNENLFKESNIGLLSLTENKNSKKVIKPKKNNNIKALNKGFAAEYILSKLPILA